MLPESTKDELNIAFSKEMVSRNGELPIPTAGFQRLPHGIQLEVIEILTNINEIGKAISSRSTQVSMDMKSDAPLVISLATHSPQKEGLAQDQND